MTEPTKWQKFKTWVHDNPEAAIYSTALAGATVLYTWVLVVSYKDAKQSVENAEKALNEYNEWADGMNVWLNDEQNKGNGVYQLSDGRYLVVPLDAPQETVIK